MNAATEMLKRILEDLENLGIGEGEEDGIPDDVDGSDAVDYLNALKVDILAFLKGRAANTTRKDAELLAAALARPIPSFPTALENHAALCAWEQTCRVVADVLTTTEPRFNRASFLKAAGVAC